MSAESRSTSLRSGKLAASAAASFATSVRVMTAAVNESRVARAGIEGSEYFLRAVESGNVDAGIYLGPKTLTGSFTVRFFLLDDANDPEPNIIPLELKDIAPRTDDRKNIFWSFQLSAKQSRLAAAIILTSAEEPEYVAFVPHHYLSKNDSACRLTLVSMIIRPVWTLHVLPAFPFELAPFMLPLSSLNKAIANLRDYAMGLDDTWYVHINRV